MEEPERGSAAKSPGSHKGDLFGPSAQPPGSPRGAEQGPGEAKPPEQNAAPPAASGSEASLLGLPDELPVTWCPNCKADMKPKGKGMCPRCNRFLKGAFMARRHPVNLLRRQQLLNRLVADYQPQTTMQRAFCEDLAGVREQLENLKPGSTEWQRMIQVQQQLVTSLEDSRPGREADDAFADTLARMTDEQLAAHLEAQAAHYVEQARNLRRARELERAPCQPGDVDGGLLPDVVHVGDGNVHGSGPSVQVAAPVSSACVGPTSAPEPTCEYCHQAPARCAEIKETRIEDWRALHYSDPEEVARRDAEATAVMLKQLGQPLPDWYR